MVHMCKMIISPDIFKIFSKFWYFGLFGGLKCKNGPKWQKYLSVTLSISGTIHHWIVIYGTQVSNDNVPGCFFQFFNILIFQVVRELKWEKTVQNDKKFCPSCFIYQEPYIIWLSFMVHMCKMIISPDLFHFYKILIFWVRGVKRQKIVQNDRKFCLSHLIYQ